MQIGEFIIDGDAEALNFLRLHRDASLALIHRVQEEGSASFMINNKRFAMMPGQRNVFLVHESHGGRTSHHGRTVNPLHNYL